MMSTNSVPRPDGPTCTLIQMNKQCTFREETHNHHFARSPRELRLGEVIRQCPEVQIGALLHVSLVHKQQLDVESLRTSSESTTMIIRSARVVVDTGWQFNRKIFGLSFSLKNHLGFGLRFPTLGSKLGS